MPCARPHPLGTLTDKDHDHRRARAHRQKGLYPRQRLSSVPFDGCAGAAQADAAWRVYELPCGHDPCRHAGSPDGDSAGSRLVFLASSGEGVTLRRHPASVTTRRMWAILDQKARKLLRVFKIGSARGR